MMRFREWLTPLLLGMATPVLAAPPARDPAFARFEKSVDETKSAMMADPQAALGRAERSLRLATALPDGREARIARATAQWLEGEALIGINATGRAKPIIEDAIVAIQATAPGTKLHGDLMRSRGAVAAIEGQVQAALRDYQAAYEIFVRAREPRSQAITLQDLADIYISAGDYQRALRYYSQSSDIFHDDPYLLLTTRNNRAELLREMKRFEDAITEYRTALRNAHSVKSPLLEARILTNLAAAQVDAGQLPAADRSVAEAFRLTASGEGRGWQPYVFGVAAKVAAARGEDARAAGLFERLFAGADLTTTDMPYREFHETAAKVYEALGDRTSALAHLKAYQRLDSEARNLIATNSAQLLAARFDFANQNNKILRLKQGQLSRDIQIERQRSRFQTVVLSGLLGAGGVVLALLLFGFFSIRRSRNEVRAANDNLTETNTKLEKALAAKTEFLAMTSHEIRTPLNGILGMTQVLLADKRIDPGVRGKVEVVHGAGEAMKALVDDILDVAKMETGEVTITRAPTDLRRILAETIRLWSGQAEVKGLALALAAEEAPNTIMGDDARLRQIIFNLLSNSIKFTPSGSVTLDVTAEDHVDGEELVIRVRDTGIGIAADQQELIFESFRQVDGGLTRQHGGTGLGLAICQRLVVAMGGQIAVESAPGTGATFIVRLPLDRVEANAAATVQEVREPGFAGARLLFVEANLLKQAIVKAMIEPAVTSFASAGNAEAAAEAIRSGAADHVLIDAESGCGGSLEAMRALVTTARAADTLATILYLPGAELSEAAMLTLGADQLVAKPIGGPGLAAALAQLHETTKDESEIKRLSSTAS